MKNAGLNEVYGTYCAAMLYGPMAGNSPRSKRTNILLAAYHVKMVYVYRVELWTVTGEGWQNGNPTCSVRKGGSAPS